MSIKQSNYIKLIAIITMLIDHIGMILFPNQIIFRIIGRIAFPLFAYQIGIGYVHTKNIKKYILRLLSFGICLQLLFSAVIYFFKINESLGYLNIFFTLALGLLAIYCYENKKNIYLLLIIILSIVLEYLKIKLDYSLYGIMLILVLYMLYTKRKNNAIMIGTVSLISLIYSYYLGDYTQMYCLIAIFFIMKPLSLNLKLPNYFFYLFYPIHLIILYTINLLIK